MADTGRYAPWRRANVDLLEPGYLKAWLNILTDFTTLVEPVLSVTPVIGELYTVATSHTWISGKEAIPIYVHEESLEAPGESSGEVGSQRLIWRPKIFVLGDGAKILEMMNNWLNQQLIVFVQDQCAPAKYIQFGNVCYPLKLEKLTGSSGQLLSGQKGYEITGRTLTKYFYNGTISEHS